MKKKLLTRLFSFGLMILFFNCSDSLSSQDTTLIGEYCDSTGYLTFDFQKINNSISGTHCFVTDDGKYLDCCSEENTVSINLHYIDSNIFKGTLTSCFDYNIYEVRIIIYNNYFEFSFEDKEHPFLSKSIRFYPKKIVAE
jgi:hypothetical protein